MKEEENKDCIIKFPNEPKIKGKILKSYPRGTEYLYDVELEDGTIEYEIYSDWIIIL